MIKIIPCVIGTYYYKNIFIFVRFSIEVNYYFKNLYWSEQVKTFNNFTILQFNFLLHFTISVMYVKLKNTFVIVQFYALLYFKIENL